MITNCVKPIKKYFWDIQKQESFRNNLMHVKPQIERVVNEICDTNSYDDIVHGIHQITSMIHSGS